MNVKCVKLTNWDSFVIELDEPFNLHFDFFIDDNAVASQLYQSEGAKLYFRFDNEHELLGHELKIKTHECGEHIVDVTDAVDFYGFDNKYYYELNDLGATYNKTYTSFKLWAPLASKVILHLNDREYELSRKDKGIYLITVDGDYDGAPYFYKITNNGKEVRVIDPYGKSSSFNATFSNVINPEKITMEMYDESLPEFKSYLDAVIYEASVRDMTSDISTDIQNKGKFLGLIERNRKTQEGHEAGFDYLLSLGFTHLQLMPVLDFATKDENDTLNNYNWGYDPVQFFALEGSYSSEPNNPYSRILEFKKVVRDFHRAGVRINLDVVYNHVYEVRNSIFDKVVPNYFFRRKNGKLFNHSGCGNDVASERLMSRKLIIDSLLFLVNEYHVDGFRFDLMGLLDVETMQLASKKLREIKPDIMLYGEGWDMLTETSNHLPLANMNNASLLPDFAFFNDRYRNIVRGCGGTSSLDENGYMLGNLAFKDGFKFVYAGSSFNITYPPLFLNINQSINYVECHDNATLFDAIKNSSTIQDPVRLIKKINKLIFLSFGIPFIHAGQEIALSKFNHSNTYNEGDHFNKFSYKILDQRYEMVNAFRAYIKARKEITLFHTNDLQLIDKNVDFIDHNNLLEIKLTDIKENHQIYHIYINPTDKGIRQKFDYVADFYFPFGFRKNIEKNRFSNVDIAREQVSIFVEVDKKN